MKAPAWLLRLIQRLAPAPSPLRPDLEASVLRLQPGDILWIKVREPLPMEAIKQIADHIKGRLPDGVKAVITEFEYSLTVLREGQPEHLAPVDVGIAPPAGWREAVYAKDQPEYSPLPTLRAADGRAISRWRPSPEARIQVAAGADIYLTVHTFNQPLQPVMLTIGGAAVDSAA